MRQTKRLMSPPCVSIAFHKFVEIDHRPAGQGLHEEEPEMLVNVPLVHGSCIDMPSDGHWYPELHGRQITEPSAE